MIRTDHGANCYDVNSQCTQIQVASSGVSLLQIIIFIVWNDRLLGQSRD